MLSDIEDKIEKKDLITQIKSEENDNGNWSMVQSAFLAVFFKHSKEWPIKIRERSYDVINQFFKGAGSSANRYIPENQTKTADFLHHWRTGKVSKYSNMLWISILVIKSARNNDIYIIYLSMQVSRICLNVLPLTLMFDHSGVKQEWKNLVCGDLWMRDQI